jgi:hypothetical protein
MNKTIVSMILIALVLSACAAPTPPPPTVTSTAVPPTATATSVPPTETPTPIPAFLTASKDLYTHRSGAFSFHPPEGWTLTETDFDAQFLEPNGNGQVYVSVTNTGYALDETGLANFVKANESNYFAAFFEDYKQDAQISNKYDPSTQSIQVVKTLTSSGTPWHVVTNYYQVGQTVMEVTFWILSENQADAYFPLLADMKFQEGTAANLMPYAFVHTFVDHNKLFQFDVPNAWTYEFSGDEQCYVDTFTSPDGQAAIQNITCDTGQTMNQAAAGQFALGMLNNAYTSGSGDIKISKDEPQPDGSEKLTWSSKKGGYSGVSFFETRGTRILLLTMFAGNTVYAVFDPTFGNVISTYKVP